MTATVGTSSMMLVVMSVLRTLRVRFLPPALQTNTAIAIDSATIVLFSRFGNRNAITLTPKAS